MPPRREGGRRTRRSVEESRAGSDDDAQVEDVTRQIGGMELVLARFQRTNPPTLAGNEGGARAEACLVQMEELFDTLEYAPEKRLKLAVLQLRDDAQRWWRSTSRMLRDSGTVLSWDAFCEAFRREYTPESYFASRERQNHEAVDFGSRFECPGASGNQAGLRPLYFEKFLSPDFKLP
ncbi:hypothetical protein F511_27761 [Dorcoceras hygrometricum]|uniref:Retrotransposon gag domain-containing protein n=1 Tax=Dorcoceras hygrometricum TaxID=472368 RepID=A0A2Z7B188_9LAMI|nr:hypothetical protein F511_27761 [Dorcoceras hygrometricum]